MSCMKGLQGGVFWPTTLFSAHLFKARGNAWVTHGTCQVACVSDGSLCRTCSPRRRTACGGTARRCVIAPVVYETRYGLSQDSSRRVR